MQIPDLLVGICTQRSIIRIVGMGGNQDVFRCRRTADFYNDRSMGKYFPLKVELEKVAGLQFFNGDFFCERAGRNGFAQSKVVEIFYSGPGWRFFVCADIVPAKGGGEIHDTRPGI